MGKILILFLALFAYANDLPSPLGSQEHKGVYKSYYAKILDNLDHSSKEATQYKQKHCQMGLSEACGDVGVEYMLGFSLPKDDQKARQYIEFAAKNSKLDSQKKAYKIALQIAQNLNTKSGEKMKSYIKEAAWSSADKCVENGIECEIALAYFYLLPYKQFGFKSENEMISYMQKIYKSDKSGFLLQLSAEILIYAQIFNIKF